MAIVLGVVAALSYGLSDFLGGLMSRRVHYALVALIGFGVGWLLTAAAVLVSGSPIPSGSALGWGAASGIGSASGTLLLYRGLARGRMGIVAPLSAICTAALPVIAGVVLGDRPSVVAWGGVAAALPAIWLVSTSKSDRSASSAGRSPLASGAIEGLLAGVGFALLLVALKLAGDDGGLWPVIAGQTCGLAVLVVALAGILRGLDRPRISRRDGLGIAAVGITGSAATITYFVSTHQGLLSIVAVLTSLYPAATILLARLLLHESISRRQAGGLALAGLAILLIVVG